MCRSNFSPNTLGKFCISLGILTFFGSCSEDPEIQSYSITPEYDGPMIVWKLPDHWGENPELSGPLAGSFHVKTDSGPKGRIGVMPFREAVSSLEITNMFGMELGYQGFNQETLKQVLQVKKIEGKNFDWIRLTERVQSENPSTALLAILRNDQDTWLFPFIADAQLINAEMESFTNFLGSIIARAGKKKIRAVMPALPPPRFPQQVEIQLGRLPNIGYQGRHPRCALVVFLYKTEMERSWIFPSPHSREMLVACFPILTAGLGR